MRIKKETKKTNMKKLYFQITIVLLTLFALYYAFNNYKNDNEYDIKIEKLNKVNDSLLVANKKIQLEISTYIEQNKIKEDIIKELMDRDSVLQKQIANISIDLKKIKKKYEEANNRANSLTSDDIEKYFTDL
jgi:hypothetical protein